MNNMAKLLQPHEMVYFDRLGVANPVHVVASQVNQHDMLCPIFLRSQKLSTETFILWWKLMIVLDVKAREERCN